MKKFNPSEELDKVQKKKSVSNSSKLSSMYVPILVVACSCLALVGVTFSAKLVDSTKETYTIKIEIIDGNETSYIKEVPEGAFRDTITSSGTFGSMSCTSGNLTYDALTSSISSVYVNQDISCVLAFMDDGTKNIAYDSLGKVNDNNGTAYYYRVDAENNYIVVNDMMFRIIRVNGDGTLRLMLDEDLLFSDYGNFNFTESNLRNVLNAWYKDNLEGYDKLVETDFDDNDYDTYDMNSFVNLYGWYYGYVGTLSVREVELMTYGVESTKNFLNTNSGLYLMNNNGDNVYAYKNSKVVLVDGTELLSVRPVINIGDVELIGQGTKENPYTIS